MLKRPELAQQDQRVEKADDPPNNHDNVAFHCRCSDPRKQTSAEQNRKSKGNFVKNVHLNIRPFSCTFCASTFHDKPTMEIHEKSVHGIGENEFECDHCEYQAASKQQIKSHMKRRHSSIE